MAEITTGTAAAPASADADDTAPPANPVVVPSPRRTVAALISRLGPVQVIVDPDVLAAYRHDHAALVPAGHAAARTSPAPLREATGSNEPSRRSGVPLPEPQTSGSSGRNPWPRPGRVPGYSLKIDRYVAPVSVSKSVCVEPVAAA
jgi:hypothetical protein